LALIAVTLRIIIWVAIAGFFAIVLAPAVARVQAHVRGRRAVATSIVMFTSALLVLGTLTVFALPVRSQAISAATDLPGTIDAAAEGEGPVGRSVKELHLQSFVRDHQEDIEQWADDLKGSSFSIARRVINIVVAVITVFVLTFLFLTQSSALSDAAIRFVPERRRPAVRRAAADAARAISGYMIGNLLVSLIAGAAAFLCLLLLGVPNPIVLAL
jgi:predicted PurR-regulated permease PerM